MELKIDKTPIATARLDLKGFRESLKRDLNLREAVNYNIKVMSNKLPVPEAKIVEMIYFFTDWADIIRVLPKRDEEVMNIRVCNIEYADKIQYKPGVSDGLNFKLKEKKIAGTMVIVINDLVSDINNTIKMWIDQAVPTFVFGLEPKWVPLEVYYDKGS